MSKPETDAPFRVLDWVLLLGSAMIWGASFLFIAIGIEAFAPGVVTFLRVATGAIFIGVLPGAWRPVERGDLPKIAWLAVTWIAFPLTMFPIAQQWIDSSLAGMLNAAMPLGTVAISWLCFATPTSGRRMVGVAVGVVGVLLIGFPVRPPRTRTRSVSYWSWRRSSRTGFAINIAGPVAAQVWLAAGAVTRAGVVDTAGFAICSCRLARIDLRVGGDVRLYRTWCRWNRARTRARYQANGSGRIRFVHR